MAVILNVKKKEKKTTHKIKTFHNFKLVGSFNKATARQGR
jgi:hypothetical protein